MNKCPTCGYEMEAANLPYCVSCHVANLDRQEADAAQYLDDPDGLPSTSDEAKSWEAHVESKCHD